MQTQIDSIDLNQRRYDVDWVRSLAFMVLILYHIGMYYVADWGWHVKSLNQSTLLQELMILTNPWRMSLLFFVSGMTMALIQHKYRPAKLIATRSKRILVPLLFGMLVIVPPQLYFELLHSDAFSGSYIQFLLEYYNLNTELAPHKQSPIGLLTWNHLWYLPYLFCYTLVLLALQPALNRIIQSGFMQRLNGWYFIAFVALLFCVARLSLRADFPSTHALVDDWYNHARYLLAMLAGYAMAMLPGIWQSAIQRRRRLLMAGLVSYAFFVADRNGLLPIFAEWYHQYDVVKLFYAVIVASNVIGWIGAAIGYAGRYLNRDSDLLRYLNDAVLPSYVLHQTLIILLAMALLPMALPAALEAIILTVATFTLCWLGFEVIRRVNVLRFVFGMKWRKANSTQRSADNHAQIRS